MSIFDWLDGEDEQREKDIKFIIEQNNDFRKEIRNKKEKIKELEERNEYISKELSFWRKRCEHLENLLLGPVDINKDQPSDYCENRKEAYKTTVIDCVNEE